MNIFNTKKEMWIGIGVGIVLILLLVLGLNKCNTSKYEDGIISRDGKISILQEQVNERDKKIKSLDSAWNVLKQSNTELTIKYSNKVVENKKITDENNRMKNDVAKLTNSESVEYFKNKTNTTFPIVLINATPDSTYEIPSKAIKNANGLFVENDGLVKLNDNLKQQKIVLLVTVDNLNKQLTNRNNEIEILTSNNSTKDRQIGLLNENIESYEKLLKKEKRKAGIFKLTTTAGIVAVIVALVIP